MAELDIDQTNLPRVQDVCQCFAVLEDGVLAHNLQEQEIEHYYTNNIQKNQLVQNDIRVAKRLQDEEEEQWAQQSALHRHASRQLEEQDFEYARVIQEEILRHAEETQRREQDDEEIAKRMQEEEKQRNRRRIREQEGHTEGSTSDPALPSPRQHTLSSLQQGEEQYLATASRWQCSTSSHNHSDLSEPRADSPRGVAAQENTTSWSNQGHTNSYRKIRSELREPLSEDSEDSDSVFSEQLSALSQRRNQRLNMAPPRLQASLHQPQERQYRGPTSRRSFPDELRVWEEEEEGEWDGDYYENGDHEKGSTRNRDQERSHRKENEGFHRSRNQGRDSRLEVRQRRCSRSESVRLHDRTRQNNKDLVRTWSYRDNPDRHVHFRDDTKSSSRHCGESSSVWEMLGQVLKERGVPVRFDSNGMQLQIGPQNRDSQVLCGSEVSCSDSQPHQRVFQRAATTRHSFHGDIRERRRLSYQENSGRDHREDRDRHRNIAGNDGEIYEISSRGSHLANRERGGSRKAKEHRCTEDDERVRNANNYRVKRTTSERRRWHKTIEERLSSEEEQEVERRRMQPCRRAPQRSQSFCSSRASTRDRSRHVAAGGSSQPEPGEQSLDLGELQQVLEDEEFARKLQQEEDKLLRRSSQPSRCGPYPEGDFRVAQVAQDEEIAHFMQKQEIRSKRHSRELEGPESWRQHRAMIAHHDRRAARDRQVQRERLDSEGLPSPTEDCPPEIHPPSPTSSLPQAQQIRNIAEELDPTFQARRQGSESLGGGQTSPSCQLLPMPQSGINDFLEEPTFIPPTKRQADKLGRPKPKEKKENCKQQ